MDLEAIRKQYESMTDVALLELDPQDLVDDARQCLAEELQKRHLQSEPVLTEPDSDIEVGDIEWLNRPEPDWVSEAACVLTVRWTASVEEMGRVTEALAVLDTAGIPNYVRSEQQETRNDGRPTVTDFLILVPPAQVLRATSFLDRDLVNADLEADWRAHFEMMTDDELLDIDEDALAAGMRDRIERLIHAWEDELLKRGLAELETSEGTE